jgi:hypothetical protein
MTNIRRSFTTDFKLEAAQLVTQQGYSFAEASRSLRFLTWLQAVYCASWCVPFRMGK